MIDLSRPLGVRTGAGRQLVLTQELLTHLHASDGEEVTVGHGAMRAPATISQARSPVPSGQEDWAVSRDLQAALGIVAGLPYRAVRSGDLIRIGPVIGIAVRSPQRTAARRPEGPISHMLAHYPEVGGLVYFFAPGDLSPGKESVGGLRWQPRPGPDQSEATRRFWERHAQEGARLAANALADGPVEQGIAISESFPDTAGGDLVPGIFPFPDAVWRRANRLPARTYARLKACAPGRVFNSWIFDKAEAYRMFSRFPGLRPHLPETRQLEGHSQLLTILRRQRSVVLKLKRGYGGHGLVRVDETGDGFEVCDDDSEQKWRCRDLSANPAVARCLRNPARYLVQARVDLPTYKGRQNEYRAVMQKDGAGVWTCRGWFGRFGQPGLPTSGVGTDGYRLPGEESIVRVFGCGRSEAQALGRRIVRLATMVCDALDRTGECYGDLALDISVDRSRRLWLLEANKLHNPLSPARQGNMSVYLAVRSGPLLYASYLAGFPCRETGESALQVGG